MPRNPISLIAEKFGLDPDHQRIARAIVMLAIFLIVGKAAGAIKEMSIAYRFGVGELVDAFVLTLTFVTWLPSVWTSVLNSVYVPLINSATEEEQQKFSHQIMAMTLISAGILTLFIMLVGPLLITMFAGNMSTASQTWLRQFVIGLAPMAGLGLIVAQLSVQLLAAERHANTLYNAIAPLTLTVVILLWPEGPATSYPLIIGSIVGLGLQVIGLYLLLSQKIGSIWAALSFNSTMWRRFRQGVGVMVIAQFVMSFVDPISSLIAAGLGPGNIASMGFTLAILSLFLSLGSTAVSRAILPVLSNTDKPRRRIISVAFQWSAVMLGSGLLLAVFVWFAAPWLVKLIYERGAFTAEDTRLVSDAVRLGVFQFPFYFSGIVLVQLFASFGLYRVILGSGIIALIVKVLTSTYFAVLASRKSFIYE